MCERDYNKLITIPTKGAIEINANILNFGAACDGKTLCTAAIQAAIDACAASGGGTVTVPCGKFITGTLWLRDNVELFLSHGAILKASDDLDDYNAEDAYEQNFSSRANEKWLGKHMIIAHECENVAVCGTGMLDGNGDHFLGEALPYSAYVWSEGCRTARDPELCRPGQLLCFIECRHVKVRDITITNQPCWGCFLHGCEYVSIRGLKTLNPHANFNSDGIDIDCCSFVTISDCIIDTGDDCIAIRGAEARLKNKPHPCEHITISNCVLGSSSCSFRLGVGTGAIRHVRVSNICITRGAPAICVMSTYNGHGGVSIEDVGFYNVSVTGCARPFEIVEGAGASIKDITLENFHVETYGYFHLRAAAPGSVSNILLKNWQVVLTDGPSPIVPRDYERRGTVWFRAENIGDLQLKDFRVCDAENRLAIWHSGIFSFTGCDVCTLENVFVNDEPYK